MNEVIDQAYLERRLARCRELATLSTHPDVRNAYESEIVHCEMLLEGLQGRGTRTWVSAVRGGHAAFAKRN